MAKLFQAHLILQKDSIIFANIGPKTDFEKFFFLPNFFFFFLSGQWGLPSLFLVVRPLKNTFFMCVFPKFLNITYFERKCPTTLINVSADTASGHIRRKYVLYMPHFIFLCHFKRKLKE